MQPGATWAGPLEIDFIHNHCIRKRGHVIVTSVKVTTHGADGVL
jgi:hypothetical protein